MSIAVPFVVSPFGGELFCFHIWKSLSSLFGIPPGRRNMPSGCDPIFIRARNSLTTQSHAMFHRIPRPACFVCPNARCSSACASTKTHSEFVRGQLYGFAKISPVPETVTNIAVTCGSYPMIRNLAR